MDRKHIGEYIIDQQATDSAYFVQDWLDELQPKDADKPLLWSVVNCATHKRHWFSCNEAAIAFAMTYGAPLAVCKPLYCD
jgi:hypothetical protein